MAKLVEQRSFHLPPEIWAALDRLAGQTNSVAKRGPRARQPSVIVMFERMATGEVTVAEKEPWSLPVGLDEAVKQVEHRQRIEQHTEQKKAVQKLPLKMQQLNMLELEPA